MNVPRPTVLWLWARHWEWRGRACESSFGLAFRLDAPTVSHDLPSEVTDGVGERYGLHSGTCPDDVPKFSAEWANWSVDPRPCGAQKLEPRLWFDSKGRILRDIRTLFFYDIPRLASVETQVNEHLLKKTLVDPWPCGAQKFEPRLKGRILRDIRILFFYDIPRLASVETQVNEHLLKKALVDPWPCGAQKFEPRLWFDSMAEFWEIFTPCSSMIF